MSLPDAISRVVQSEEMPPIPSSGRRMVPSVAPTFGVEGGLIRHWFPGYGWQAIIRSKPE